MAFAPGSRKIMCVVAHPDDEALGVGATLMKHASAGDSVEIVILSDGEGAKMQESAKDPHRKSRAAQWAERAGCVLRQIHDLPDQRFDVIPMIEIVSIVESELREFKPDVIYTHHSGDLNHDHSLTCKAVLVASRPMHAGGAAPEIYAFETPSSTDQAPHSYPFSFQPNFYVVIDDLIEAKMDALEVYANELGEPPHPRSRESIRALATKRGAECGASAAEAFVMLRSVWN